MTDALLPSTRINLERATVLVLDDNGPSLDILSQVVSGFGVKQLHRAESVMISEEYVHYGRQFYLGVKWKF